MRPGSGRRWLRAVCVSALVGVAAVAGVGAVAIELVGEEARGGTATTSPPAMDVVGPAKSSRDRVLVRELEELRSRTSRTYVDDSGVRVARISPESVNYRAAGGSWQEIDNDLEPVQGGFRNRANAYSVFLPSSLGGGRVRVGKG